MSIETKTNSYKSHKHAFNVYVNLNTKTKLGQDLLGQYRKQAENQYIDVGRIGSHDSYGRYVIDDYTVKELIVVPKLIIRVTESAVDRAGRDVYQLRTYMSKFGQLNFLLLVDRDKADLVLVENIYLENLNHKENYETLLWRLSYYNQKPVPFQEIFVKYGIRANPDDYGKRWKDEDVKVNNLLVSKAKAEQTKNIANKVASDINQKALVASLNYLNNSGSYGKKITSEYSKKVSNNIEINKLAASSKLENTLNNVLIKTLEEQTTKKDLKEKENFKVYKKVIDIQFSCPNQIKQEINKLDTKENLKKTLYNIYQRPENAKNNSESILQDKNQVNFDNIVKYNYQKKTHKENTIINEEKLHIDKKKSVVPFIQKFKDFDNKVVEIDTNFDRFEKPENPKKKKQREKEEKIKQKEVKRAKQKAGIFSRIKQLNAECNIEKELEKSKTVLGIKEELKSQKGNIFKKSQKTKKASKKQDRNKENIKEENIFERLQKRIKKQTVLGKSKKVKKEKIKENKKALIKEEKKTKVESRRVKKEKKKKRDITQFATKEEKKKKKNIALTEEFRPIVKEKKEIKVEAISNNNINKIENKPFSKIEIQPVEQKEDNPLKTQQDYKEKFFGAAKKEGQIVNEKPHFDISQNKMVNSSKKEKTMEM